MSNKYDIQDDELRIIGKSPIPDKISQKQTTKKHFWIILPLALVAIAGIIYMIFPKHSMQEQEMIEEGLFEEVKLQEEPQTASRLGMDPYSLEQSFTEKIDTTINDIPLSIYIPHNATAELCIGTPDINNKSIILCAQAADIRKDNKKIVGAFVLKGEPLAWGLSKKGFCAIIGKKITIGVADNSPLFEEATEKGGYFFRQYPLVDNGMLVENEPKNKSFRKALCSRGDEIFITTTNTPESFHDFAQALVDLGIHNAVYLVGGEYAKGWYKTNTGEITDFSKSRRDKYLYENYIVWRKNK